MHHILLDLNIAKEIEMIRVLEEQGEVTPTEVQMKLKPYCVTYNNCVLNWFKTYEEAFELNEDTCPDREIVSEKICLKKLLKKEM